MKCIVRLCPNDSTEGQFEGAVCTPCAAALRGKGQTPAIKRIILSVFFRGTEEETTDGHESS